MNDRLTCISIEKGEVTVTLGDAYATIVTLKPMTVVGFMAAASADDPDLTVDLNNGVAVTSIEALVCDTAATPGTWKSTHLGGTNAPFAVASGATLTLDANGAAVDTRINVQIWALINE